MKQPVQLRKRKQSASERETRASCQVDSRVCSGVSTAIANANKYHMEQPMTMTICASLFKAGFILLLEQSVYHLVVVYHCLELGQVAAPRQHYRYHRLRPQVLVQELQAGVPRQQTHHDHALKLVAFVLRHFHVHFHWRQGHYLLIALHLLVYQPAVLHELQVSLADGRQEPLQHDHSVEDQLIFDELEDVLLAVVVEEFQVLQCVDERQLNLLLSHEEDLAQSGVVDEVILGLQLFPALAVEQSVSEKVLLAVDVGVGPRYRQQVLDDELHALVVVGGAGDDEVGVLHCRLYEVVVGRAHEPQVLFHHPVVCPATLPNVPVHPPAEPDVVVAGHEYPHPHELANRRVVECEDALEQNEVGVGQLYFALPLVGLEVVDWYSGLLPVHQLSEHLNREIHVEGVGVVEVVDTGVGALLERPVEAVERHGDRLEAALQRHHAGDCIADRSLSGSTAASHPHQKPRFEIIALLPQTHCSYFTSDDLLMANYRYSSMIFKPLQEKYLSILPKECDQQRARSLFEQYIKVLVEREGSQQTAYVVGITQSEDELRQMLCDLLDKNGLAKRAAREPKQVLDGYFSRQPMRQDVFEIMGEIIDPPVELSKIQRHKQIRRKFNQLLRESSRNFR